MIRNTLKNKPSQKPKLDFETIMKLVLFMYIDNTANGIRSKSNTCRGYFMAVREYDFFIFECCKYLSRVNEANE